VTVRIPRAGQIRLSHHISASFNSNAGVQTSMQDKGVMAACHKTSTYTPTQRSMNIAHGVITAHMGQMYRSSYYSGGQWKCDEATMTNDKIYNKIDVRKDGYLFTSNGAPSHALTGTNGQISKIWMSGDEAGAFYVQTYKKTKDNTNNEYIDVRQEWSAENCQKGWGTSGYFYTYHYGGGYSNGSPGSKNIMQTITMNSNTWTYSKDLAQFDQAYSHISCGYRIFAQYPGYNSRGALGIISPHYNRLVATAGYA